MSLLSPPGTLPAHLVPAWPWIWLQHQLLLAWLRLTYGRGYLYCWGITPGGRVHLVWIDLASRARAVVRPVETPASRRLASALSGSDPVADFLRTLAGPGPARSAPAHAGHRPAARTPALPLPDS